MCGDLSAHDGTKGAHKSAADGQAHQQADKYQMYAGHGGPIAAQDILGSWADSLGNAILVSSEDAYELRLFATLSRPPRKDHRLTIRPVPGGGWICGNAMLDPSWSTPKRLHWITLDGRISVWVSIPKDASPAHEQKVA